MNKKFKAPSYNTFQKVRNSRRNRKEDGLKFWASMDVRTIGKRGSWKFC